MTEHEQLEQAIAALEGQRAILGDAVVDAALGPLREKLAALQALATPSGPMRRQATVLFADVSGFTALAEPLDAEEVAEIMNALWARLDAAITSHGGQIDKHLGDGVMAVWGAAAAREDDPERAIHAALAMQSTLATFRQERGLPLALRIGLNTGQVLLGEIGSTREFTAMGDTVNLASRLEQAAPVDGVLISHDTYRHVRGVFDVLPQPPLAVKGKAAPVQTYVVQRARPRAFRMGTRGVEGIETRMVGREVELLALQNAFASAVSGQTRLLTVVGEAGLGKSRLLYEFENWLALRPEQVYYLKGRAAPALQHVPYSVFRDMFAHRFDILESDSAAAALEKFRAGIAGVLPPERADLVGHWIGFDFCAAASPAVQNLIGSPDFGKLAQAYLTHYVRAMAERQPTVVFLEDLHWADDSSLDLIEHLVAAIPQARLLIVGLARPELFERWPQWGMGRSGQSRLVLQPLSRPDSQALVDEILQRVESIPDALRELIVAGAEGNPFYVEELVKMLGDEGVIERGAGIQDPWRINLERLKEVHVPPTLTGLLQARLDGLPGPERELLQRAAVVGRLFWDAAVAELADVKREQLSAPLDALHERELVFRRGRSAFAGADEYLFKHALLRDVTYETVLLKLRRRYHALVARWLEAHAGERIGEYAGLIAGHLERAGLAEQAVVYLRQAAENARHAGALREAVGFSERALALLSETSPARAALLIQASKALMAVGDYEAARQQLEAGLALAHQFGDLGVCADALEGLGAIAGEQEGDWPQARAYLEKSLALARQLADRARIASVLWELGWVDVRQGAYHQARARFSESRSLYQALENRFGLILALIGLGGAALYIGEYAEAQDLYLQSLRLAREVGDRRSEAATLNCLGETARLQHDYPATRQYYQQSLSIFREIDNKVNVAAVLANLGHAASAVGDNAAAIPHYHEALRIATDIGSVPVALDNLVGLASVLAHTGRQERALAYLGMALNHPALYEDTRAIGEQALADLRGQLSPEEIEAGMDRGRSLALEAVVAEILELA